MDYVAIFTSTTAYTILHRDVGTDTSYHFHVATNVIIPELLANINIVKTASGL